MAKYVTNKIKVAITTCAHKKAVQSQTNKMFSEVGCEDASGVDYFQQRELLGQTILESLKDEAVQQKLFKDKKGKQTLFFNLRDLNSAGIRIYKQLRDLGITSKCINRWITREAAKAGITLITQYCGGRSLYKAV